MTTMRALAIAMALAWSSVAVAAPKAPVTVAAADRAVADRPIQVRLDQTEIATTIDLGRIAAIPSGDGLLAAFLVARRDDRAKTMSAIHEERAKARAAPIRAVLQGVDVHALAVATVRKAAANTPWLATARVSTADDTEPAAGSGRSGAATIAFRYDLSADLSQVRVFAEVTLPASGAKPAAGYRQRFVSIVQLRTRSYDEAENAAQWSRDGGRLIRQALADAFARLETTIPYALSLSAAEAAALVAKSHPQGFGAGLYGPLISRDPADPQKVVLWSGAFIAVQPTA